ncbi:MAG: PRC-barrel domain-containing protein [Actinomycetota bacterium]|nr:PRC-barrel domain-containing protein [Actinomycetota bacterium]
MTQTPEANDWRGRVLVDLGGERIGRVEDVYLDEETGRLEWATVSIGLFGRRLSFVPLAAAAPAGEAVQVQVSREVVNEAPAVAAGEDLAPDEEARLYRHYGLESSGRARTPARRRPRTPAARRRPRARSGQA